MRVDDNDVIADRLSDGPSSLVHEDNGEEDADEEDSGLRDSHDEVDHWSSFRGGYFTIPLVKNVTLPLAHLPHEDPDQPEPASEHRQEGVPDEVPESVPAHVSSL